MEENQLYTNGIDLQNGMLFVQKFLCANKLCSDSIYHLVIYIKIFEDIQLYQYYS
jgi:hypothetical protein